jgi:predicted nucleic acid-binding protein
VLTLDASVWVAALDPRDRFHEASAAFLRAVVERGLSLVGPAFVVVETACAMARRTQDAGAGRRVHDELLANPRLSLEPLTSAFLATAARLGAELLLRGGDALYAAAAERSGAPLVSWDEEHIRRAGALTPQQWLDAKP